MTLPMLSRVLSTRNDVEARHVALACAQYFCTLSAYYIVRPVREQVGVASGVRQLPYLFALTMVLLLALNPLFAALVSRFSRHALLPVINVFFASNLALFYVLMSAESAAATASETPAAAAAAAAAASSSSSSVSMLVWRAFFVWTSVFNLFVVSLFWSFASSVFSADAAPRLFPVVALGGTVGAICGSSLTTLLVAVVGTHNLLLASATLLLVAAACGRRLSIEAAGASSDCDVDASVPTTTTTSSSSSTSSSSPSSGLLGGFRALLSSSYLAAIAVFTGLYTCGSTHVYFLQADVVGAAMRADAAGQTRLFANVDLVVNVITVVLQAHFTARILRSAGMTFGLALLPCMSLAVFWAFSFAADAGALVTPLVVFQIARRAGEYGISRPTREVLYTVVSADERLKAKSLIDTFVYRVGDQIGAWTFYAASPHGFRAFSAYVAAPTAAIWLLAAVYLGRRHAALKLERDVATNSV